MQAANMQTKKSHPWVLVTGGLGYIGSHTVVELLMAGYGVIVVDNLANSNLSALDRIRQLSKHLFLLMDANVDVDARLVFHECDVLDRRALERVFAAHLDYRTGRCAIRAVVHFAGLKAISQSVQEPLLYYQRNVGGLLMLLEVMGAFRVQRMLFSSSASVYGEGESTTTTTTTMLRPGGFVESDPCHLNQTTSPYGRTKLVQEQILRDLSAASNWRFLVLRYFNPVGAHSSGLLGESPRHCLNLFPRLAQLASTANSAAMSSPTSDCLTVHGTDYATRDGTCVRDYVHVQDVAEAHVLALRRILSARKIGSPPDLDGECRDNWEVCNIGTGEGHTVLEVVREFTRITGANIPIKLGPRRPGDVPVLVANAAKAHRLLAVHNQSPPPEAEPCAANCRNR
jgi:UDP-glucose 4-epimerase